VSFPDVGAPRTELVTRARERMMFFIVDAGVVIEWFDRFPSRQRLPS
jgi:hypothetical protein